MSDDDWGDDAPSTFDFSAALEKKDDGGGRGRGGRGGGGFRGRGGRGGRDNDDGGSWGGRGGRGGRGGYGGGGDSRDEDRPRGFRGGRSSYGGGGGGSGSDDESGRSRGGFRGRGRGRGGNRGYSGDGSGSEDEGGSGGGYRGRGGRGGRGRGGHAGYKENGENRGMNGDSNPDGERKPPVNYIPPEDLDEDTLFGSGISSGINFSKYDAIEIKVSGENAPKAINSFETCGLKDLLLGNIKRSGYKVPTPVQKHSIPIVSSKRDLMACAQTGSGKTAAFLVPIINNLLVDKPTNVASGDSCVEPNCIILSPTRELCIQIFDEARKFAHGSILKVAKLYGGVQVTHQAQKLMSGCHILVATPGRLLDFVNRGRVRFSSVKYFVLDEADRMLDLGFLPDVEKMLRNESMVPCGERVTLMFSATFPHEIQQLAGKYLHNYLFLAVGIVGGACSDVDQHMYEVSKFNKREKLVDILQNRQNQNELTLVFVETKRNADFIAIYLCDNNFKTTSIHGDRFQSQREEALRDFKRGHMPTLVATAVAARGLDIKNVAHVINYDLPKSIDEYVHRIGRTGRVGNRGKATSFYDSNEDRSLAKDLVKILEQAGQEVPSFLKSEASDSRYSASGGGLESFGGTDIRGNNSNFKTTNNIPVQIEEEEGWDD